MFNDVKDKTNNKYTSNGPSNAMKWKGRHLSPIGIGTYMEVQNKTKYELIIL